jgi:hypothetical protein
VDSTNEVMLSSIIVVSELNLNTEGTSMTIPEPTTAEPMQEKSQTKGKVGRPKKQELRVSLAGNTLTATLTDEQTRTVRELADMLDLPVEESLKADLQTAFEGKAARLQQIRAELAEYKAKLRDKYK